MRLAVDLYNIYKTYFKPPYTLGSTGGSTDLPSYGLGNTGMTTDMEPFKIVTDKPGEDETVKSLKLFKKGLQGREVFLPVEFWISNSLFLQIDCCTIRITNKKTIVRTAVAERKGTVKEQYSIGDYIFTIKGVLIGQNKQFPDKEILRLKELYETSKAVELKNAYIELFYDSTGSRQIAIESLEFPEQEGKGLHHRPFVLVCESDVINTLKIEE